MKRMKLSTKLGFILVGLIFFTFLTFRLINKKVMPIFLDYADEETHKLATLIINDAVNKQVVEDLTVDDLFIMTKDDNGEIVSIDFNSITVNRVLTKTTSAIEQNLRYLEKGKIELLELPDNVLINYDDNNLKEGIIFEIPTGVLFNNSLLSNIGPKIPVRINLVGSIISGVSTKVTNYGINNALIEVYVDLEVSLKVLIPFISDTVKVNTSVPVAIKLIRGNIPEYYSNGINSPELSIPIE